MNGMVGKCCQCGCIKTLLYIFSFYVYYLIIDAKFTKVRPKIKVFSSCLIPETSDENCMANGKYVIYCTS